MKAEGNLDALAPLLGRWAGEGEARFPTIKTFEYREDLRFELDPGGRPLIHYEQRATQREVGTAAWLPSHWESGFLRPADDGAVEMTNAQDSGRLEILRFAVTATPGGVVLSGESTLLANDPRVVRTRREIEVAGDLLTYRVIMATPRVGELELHLRARLRRATG